MFSWIHYIFRRRVHVHSNYKASQWGTIWRQVYNSKIASECYHTIREHLKLNDKVCIQDVDTILLALYYEFHAELAEDVTVEEARKHTEFFIGDIQALSDKMISVNH